MERERKKLGDLLVDERIIDENQLEEALRLQEENGGILGNILVERGFVEESVLVPLLARHYAGLLPTIADCRISDHVISLLPASMARAHLAMPINAATDRVTVAMADPMNDAAVEALASYLRRKVRPVMCPRDTMLKALATHYGPAVSEDVSEAKAPPLFPLPPPAFAFESFVVGDSNRMAYLAAEAAGDFPGTTHNPLFIHGEVGHGKTHLLCSIGNRALGRDPSRHIAWLPAVELERQLVDATEKHRVHGLRAMYQRADVLLLDDIQFLARGSAVQQEFARLFALLGSQGRQIAVTSDRPLSELDALVEELRSQFSAGASVKVGVASVALKTAILMAKQKGSPMRLSDNLIAELARALPDDIRYLEGTLRNLSVRLALSGERATADTIRRMLRQMGTIPG
jgi:chromosomal replication initiator protein DnaA